MAEPFSAQSSRAPSSAISLDLWLGTDPWFVVIGILVGSYSGFVRMWHLSKQMENGPDEVVRRGR